MDDWKEYKFSEIASFISEKINISDITTDFYISTDNMIPNFGGIFPAEKLPQASKCNSFKKYDILFSNIRTYFKKIWLATFSGGCSADVLVIRSKDENLILQKYLYLLICSPDFINFTIASSNGAKMPRGDKNAMLNYTLLVPPISYQKKAINLYLKFNAKIELNTQTNQTLEAIAQAIFKHWFIDFAPVHAKADALAAGKTAEQAELAAMTSISGKTEADIIKLANSNPQAYQQLQQTAAAFPSEFVESEMGLVPKGWEVKPLDEICSMKNGYAFKSKEWTDSGIPVIKIGSVKPMIVDVDSNGFVDTENEFLRKEFLVQAGDILIGLTGYVGEVGRIPNNRKAMLNQRVAKFLPNKINEYISYYCFVYCLARSQQFKQFAETYSKGAAQANVSTKDLLTYPTVIANDVIHIAFEKQVFAILEKILVNAGMNETLAQTRDTLLPKLLSGEIKL
ncbi:hypothetical protein QV09_03490 [Gallibacterium salpingitidis]|uniref:Type I restriction modification DNA specificity domain-containing protein n=1 Tax=Gallibacterium salpingitidis TaxID=505341 RepID=A0AB36E3S4_9PAST|nr:restriction endonuclease subunit S [Gallibacterium salpingitidis]OBX11200.1 hypothetical protein QV09_03490 [Gallibacterium salpingitidis]